jgi:hypothetical protein
MRDDDAIDRVIESLYETISGPPGARDWKRLRGLFVPDARLVHVTRDPPRRRLWRRVGRLLVRSALRVARGRLPRAVDEGPPRESQSVDQFIEGAKASFAREGLWERETARRVDVSGSIAHAMSSYEARRAPTEPPFSRGVSSIQLVRTKDAWRILSLVWNDDTPA